jgi:hypothetical protein
MLTRIRAALSRIAIEQLGINRLVPRVIANLQ